MISKVAESRSRHICKRSNTEYSRSPVTGLGFTRVWVAMTETFRNVGNVRFVMASHSEQMPAKTSENLDLTVTNAEKEAPITGFATTPGQS